MSGNDQSTRQRILAEGKVEFLEKGFKDASLRAIVKRAGVTTGAFYGYFPDKQALFRALVEPAVDGLKGLFVCAHRDFESLPEDVQRNVVYEYSVPYERRMIAYIYEHFDAFKLLVCRADGTAFSDFVGFLVDIEAEATLRFIHFTGSDALAAGRVTPELIHIVSSAYFSAVFETVAHDMTREAADRYIESLRQFFTAGWKTILDPKG